MALTRRQKDFLDFLQNFIDRHGYSPSYEEIAAGLNLASLATIHKHVAALEAKGYIRRGHNQSRSLEVSPAYRRERPAPDLSVPLAGRIAAGLPVEAFPSDERLNFADFAGSPETYALQVRGDSMIDDHICNGDYVLIERTAQLRDGDIAVALVEGSETTLKRIYREPGDRIRLQPANSAMEPIVLDAAAVQVQGRVLAVLRKYK